jgi:hypothetical protein
MQLNILDAIVRVRAEILRSNKCCRLHCISRNAKKNFTSDKVYAVCSPHSSGENSGDRSGAFHVMYEKYIKICVAFFGFFLNIVWLYIQMLIWQPCTGAQ